jgi:hypothetical protein
MSKTKNSDQKKMQTKQNVPVNLCAQVETKSLKQSEKNCALKFFFLQNINVIEINIFSYHPTGLEFHSASAKFTNQRVPPQTIGMKKKP